MYCHCQPQQPAVTRKVQKDGPNKGKDFVACANNRCGFFQFLDAKNAHLFRPERMQQLKQATGPVLPKISFTIRSFEEDNQIVLGISGALNSDFLTKLQAIPTVSFSQSLKMWTFDITSYNKVVTAAKDSGYAPEELPRFLTEGLKKFLLRIASIPKAPASVHDLNIAPGLKNKMRPFQLEGVRFIISRGGRGLIADEMGCGKTVQGIAILQHYRSCWPALIIVPPNLVAQWKNELLDYCSELINETDLCIISQSKSKIYGKLCVISYTMIDKFVESKKLAPELFGMVILDESHNIKSQDAKRTQMILPFLKKINIAICLSGTPAVNRPVELFTQLSGLLPSVFNDYYEFIKRYCDAKISPFTNNWEAKGASNQHELKLLLENMVMVRRLKKDVIEDLPDKIRESRYVEADSKYALELQRLKKSSELLDTKLREDLSLTDEQKVKMKNEQQQILLQYWQVTGLSKISSIRKELVQFIEAARLEKAIIASKNENQKESTNHNFQNPVDGSDTKSKVIDFLGEEFDLERAIQSSAEERRTSGEKRKRDSEVICLDGNDYDEDKDHQGASKSKKKPGNRRPLKTESQKGKKIIKDPIILDLEEDIITKPMALNDDEEDNLCDTDEEIKGSSPSRKKQRRLLKGHEKEIKKSKRSRKQKRIYDDEEEEDDDQEDDLRDFIEDYEETEYCKDREEEEEDDDDDAYDYEDEAEEGEEEYDDDDNDQAYDDDIENLEESPENEGAHGKKNFFQSKQRQQKSKKASTSKKSLKQSTLTSKSPAKSGTRNILGQKIIVFAHHQAVLDAIEAVLRETEVSYIRVDGSTTRPKKARLIQEFQTDDQIDVALLSVTACGTGLNLTSANVALFAELYWTPGVLLQAEDRIHRIGQQSKEVKIIYMLARNTADDIVWSQLERKKTVLHETIGNDNQRCHVVDSSTSMSSSAALLKAFTAPNSSQSSSSSINNGNKSKQKGGTDGVQSSLDAFVVPTPLSSQTLRNELSSFYAVSSQNSISHEKQPKASSNRNDLKPFSEPQKNPSNQSNYTHPNNNNTSAYYSNCYPAGNDYSNQKDSYHQNNSYPQPSTIAATTMDPPKDYYSSSKTTNSSKNSFNSAEFAYPSPAQNPPANQFPSSSSLLPSSSSAYPTPAYNQATPIPVPALPQKPPIIPPQSHTTLANRPVSADNSSNNIPSTSDPYNPGYFSYSEAYSLPVIYVKEEKVSNSSAANYPVVNSTYSIPAQNDNQDNYYQREGTHKEAHYPPPLLAKIDSFSSTTVQPAAPSSYYVQNPLPSKPQVTTIPVNPIPSQTPYAYPPYTAAAPPSVSSCTLQSVPTPSTSSQLTAEQQEKIKKSEAEALRRLKAKQQQQQALPQPPPPPKQLLPEISPAVALSTAVVYPVSVPPPPPTSIPSSSPYRPVGNETKSNPVVPPTASKPLENPVSTNQLTAEQEERMKKSRMEAERKLKAKLMQQQQQPQDSPPNPAISSSTIPVVVSSAVPVYLPPPATAVPPSSMPGYPSVPVKAVSSPIISRPSSTISAAAPIPIPPPSSFSSSPQKAASTSLTEEQKAQIERNRLAAIEKQRQKELQLAQQQHSNIAVVIPAIPLAPQNIPPANFYGATPSRGSGYPFQSKPLR